MTARFGTPTIIESDAHAVTLGHHWFGKARDLEDMVLISLEQTLGLGVLHRNDLFRGAGGLSHNLGDLVLVASPEGTVRLASQAGENAILASRPADGRFAEAIRLGRGIQHAQALVLAQDNDLIAAAQRAGAAIGLTLANIVTLFAPPRVIFVGSSLDLGAPFIDSIRTPTRFPCRHPYKAWRNWSSTTPATSSGHRVLRLSRSTNFTNRLGTPQAQLSEE